MAARRSATRRTRDSSCLRARSKVTSGPRARPEVWSCSVVCAARRAAPSTRACVSRGAVRQPSAPAARLRLAARPPQAAHRPRPSALARSRHRRAGLRDHHRARQSARPLSRGANVAASGRSRRGRAAGISAGLGRAPARGCGVDPDSRRSGRPRHRRARSGACGPTAARDLHDPASSVSVDGDPVHGAPHPPARVRAAPSRDGPRGRLRLRLPLRGPAGAAPRGHRSSGRRHLLRDALEDARTGTSPRLRRGDGAGREAARRLSPPRRYARRLRARARDRDVARRRRGPAPRAPRTLDVPPSPRRAVRAGTARCEEDREQEDAKLHASLFADAPRIEQGQFRDSR
jgi:hypothetical protein